MKRWTHQFDHGHLPADIEDRLSNAAKTNPIRDLVYGAVDGTITTFAIISGVAGAGMSQQVIVVLGIANVLADGFSMAASNYLGTHAEQENHQRLVATEYRHLEEFPDGEVAELKAILARHGLAGDALENGVNVIKDCKPLWVNLMLSGEYGISPSEPRPLASAIATFIAFIVCGALPLVPFILGLESAYTLAAFITGTTFIGIGAVKSLWSIDGWVKSSLQTVLIGGCAAAIAYATGALLSDISASITRDLSLSFQFMNSSA